MISEHAHDRIADHEDWKDSINQFRLRTREELMEINNKLDTIIKALTWTDKEKSKLKEKVSQDE